jgi:hypothetical protein
MNEGKTSMKIDLSLTSKSWCSVSLVFGTSDSAPNVGVGDSSRSATRPAEHHMHTYKDKAVQPPAIGIITRNLWYSSKQGFAIISAYLNIELEG